MGAHAHAPIEAAASSSACKLSEIVDYKLALSEEDRDVIYRLRYEAYLREKAIEPNFGLRLTDRHDQSDNTFIFGVYISQELCSSMRVTVATSDYPEFPSRKAFGDVLDPILDSGKVLLDPSRLVTSERATRKYRTLLPLLTSRIAWMACEHFGVDTMLATVRTEHQAFYRRVFGFEVVTEPREYPQLIKPLSLMLLDFQRVKHSVQLRYPHFRSTGFERRMLFDPLGMAADLVIGRQREALSATNRQAPSYGAVTA